MNRVAWCMRETLLRPVDFQGGGAGIFFGNKYLRPHICPKKYLSTIMMNNKYFSPCRLKKIFTLFKKIYAWSLNGKQISALFICKKMVWFQLISLYIYWGSSWTLLLASPPGHTRRGWPMAIHIGGIYGTAVTICSAVAHGHIISIDKLAPYGINVCIPFIGNWDPIESNQGRTDCNIPLITHGHLISKEGISI